jgi:replicative DNA helicase
MALSQLSRYVERHGSDKRPGLADLRESGAIEQDADDVWFLYREAYYDPSTAKKNIAEVIVSKARNGATGMVELHFTPHLSRFYNSTNSYEEPDDVYWGTADWDNNR